MLCRLRIWSMTKRRVSRSYSSGLEMLFESEMRDVEATVERFLTKRRPPKVKVQESSVAGLGLFADQTFEKNELVTFYPGTVYAPGDTGVFLVSIRNDYILRRNDGFTVDGKPFGLSRMIYNDIVARDALNVNTSWIDDDLLSCGLGHRVNTSNEANLVYVEVEIPKAMLEKNHTHLYPKIVNTSYCNEHIAMSPYFTRSIGLFTLKPVSKGEEFFVSYNFIATPPSFS